MFYFFYFFNDLHNTAHKHENKPLKVGISPKLRIKKTFFFSVVSKLSSQVLLENFLQRFLEEFLKKIPQDSIKGSSRHAPQEFFFLEIKKKSKIFTRNFLEVHPGIPPCNAPDFFYGFIDSTSSFSF